MSAVSCTCFHCGEPIAEGIALKAHVGNEVRAVCCIGCRAAAEWIATLGLGDYYRLRDAPAARADAVGDFSAWDRAQLQRLYVRNIDSATAETSVLVDGITCAACSWLIERALRGVPGVREVEVQPAAKSVHIAFAPATIALSSVLERIARLGYVPHPRNADSLDASRRRDARDAMKRLVVAGLGMMQAMMYAITLYAGAFEGMEPATRDFFRWLGLVVTTPVVFYAAQPFFVGARRELRTGGLGMDTLVALAIALIYAASVYETFTRGAQVYFDSAGMFVFLLLGSRYLEMRARQRAADRVDALARLTPALAQRRLGDGSIETVGVHELATDDVAVVAVGSTVPADGTLLDAACDVDESVLSGEATPRARRRGETLIAGSIARSGPFALRVTQVGADTALSAIVRLMTRAQAQRTALARFGDYLARRFVGGVLLLTALTACTWLWLDPAHAFAAALAVLVVSCPCAFALSAPIVHARVASVLARSGVLLLRPDALEKLARTTHCIFDKTGTLTLSRIELADVRSAGRLSRDACLALAVRLEESSNHPIAAALRAAAPTQNTLPPAQNLRHIAGAGVEGEILDRRYRLGRAAFALGSTAPDTNDIVLADESGVLAWFGLREQLRSDAKSAVAALRAQGVIPELLSGDASLRVAAAARLLDITDFHADTSPEGKLSRLQQLRANGATVAMVGDGVNDAPVLAGADVAIALGGGAHLAQSAADIVLANDRLESVPAARLLARRARVVLQQNLVWAFVYNFVTIPFAALGWVPPWLAAIGMSASSLLAVGNALRIARLPAIAATEPERPARPFEALST
jgi:Cu2+-exporting ATPase